MKIFSLLALIILLTSCGKPNWSVTGGNPPETPGNEARLEVYVEQFEAVASELGHSSNSAHIDYEMVDSLGENILGTCQVGGGQNPLIRISKKHWAKMSNVSRQELVFHELGHCALFRGHRDDKQNNVPLSIMHPYHLGERMYKANYQQYIYELFNKQDLASALPMKSSSQFSANAMASEAAPAMKVKCSHGVMELVE